MTSETTTRPSDSDKALVVELESIFESERSKHKNFFTELAPLVRFYEAEDYHQDYLIKNPSGYCHVSRSEFEAVKALNRR